MQLLNFLIALKYYSQNYLGLMLLFAFTELYNRKLNKYEFCKRCVDEKKYYSLVLKLSVQLREVLDEESSVELRHASHQAIVVGGAILN